jgi:Tfp pilus assembly protein PilF
MSDNAAFWRTLGIAYYRADEPAKALEALARSTDLGGDHPTASLFTAMAHVRLGHPKALARSYYERVRSWMEEQVADDKRGRRLLAEAREVLGIETAAQ